MAKLQERADEYHKQFADNIIKAQAVSGCPSGEDVSSLQPEAVSRIEHALVMTVDSVKPVVRGARQMERIGCPHKLTTGHGPDSPARSSHKSVGDRNPSPQVPLLITMQALENGV